ncbi:hypothetical protein [uncultured Croceitalea sp.]|uniref:hypothetical protein n=1 Tax=uncultured Croceitalea sp. TaxID=1798908 RepID=UPI00374EBC2F
MEHKERIEKSVENKVEVGITKVVKVIFFIILGILIAFLVGYIVMRLWNWLMPDLFGLPMVGYWQAVGILILAKIIFGFGRGDGPGGNKKSKSKNWSNYRKCGPIRSDFSEWKHYDQFWKDEGEEAYEKYLANIKNKRESYD